MLQPALLISGLGHVSGCHLPPLLISQLTFKPSSLGSRAHKKKLLFAARTMNRHLPSHRCPTRPTNAETSAILWLSIISNILCDSRATLWHFVRNTRRCLVGLSACVFWGRVGFLLVFISHSRVLHGQPPMARQSHSASHPLPLL